MIELDLKTASAADLIDALLDEARGYRRHRQGVAEIRAALLAEVDRLRDAYDCLAERAVMVTPCPHHPPHGET